MPIYEYKCQACGAQEETLEKVSAPAAHACPDCGEAFGMRRQLSIASVATAGAQESSYAPSSPCAGGSCPFARG